MKGEKGEIESGEPSSGTPSPTTLTDQTTGPRGVTRPGAEKSGVWNGKESKKGKGGEAAEGEET